MVFAGTEQDVQYCEEITLAGEICDDNKAVPEESEEYAGYICHIIIILFFNEKYL